MIQVDGGYQEGGGQIVRTAIALSAITKKPVRIFNIRKNRKNPGLRPQHIEGIIAAAKICAGNVEGLRLHSPELIFYPGPFKNGDFVIDTSTAGSVTLICQTLLPIAIQCKEPCSFVIKGGTSVPFSPSFEYFSRVFCHYIKKMGVVCDIKIKKHGFYPTGGGEIVITVVQSEIKSFDCITRGSIENIDLYAEVSEHLRDGRVAERIVNGFKDVIRSAQYHTQYVHSRSPGCCATAIATTSNDWRLGATVIGEIRKRAEEVGRDTARHLNKYLLADVPVDPWIIDQIIPYVALACSRQEKTSNIHIPFLTKHAETNIWVVKKFLPVDFIITKDMLTCKSLTP